MNANRTQVEALIYESCTRLDAKDFKGFLEHRDQKFEYKLSAYSPEIKREMTWQNSRFGHGPSWRGGPGSRPQTAR